MPNIIEIASDPRLDAKRGRPWKRIDKMIKDLLTRWHKIAAFIIREAVETHFQTRH
jgi:hypothetical protein